MGRLTLNVYRLWIWLLLLPPILFWAADLFDLLTAIGVGPLRFVVGTAALSAFLSLPNYLFDVELVPGLSAACNRGFYLLLVLLNLVTSFWAGLAAAFLEGRG
ncbi:MAG TPA: hypothetical protein VLM91_15915 [Candidatus Methylomirabilis sp.]|nr:hypothetical protein [Candidatus Methylomirabilis sp.]